MWKRYWWRNKEFSDGDDQWTYYTDVLSKRRINSDIDDQMACDDEMKQQRHWRSDDVIDTMMIRWCDKYNDDQVM